MEDEIEKTGFGLLKSIRDFMKGMTGHEHALFTLKERTAIDNVVMLIFFGDLLGIPVTRPYYALRMLPFFCGRLETWKRSLLRERDWTDKAFD